MTVFVKTYFLASHLQDVVILVKILVYFSKTYILFKSESTILDINDIQLMGGILFTFSWITYKTRILKKRLLHHDNSSVKNKCYSPENH